MNNAKETGFDLIGQLLMSAVLMILTLGVLAAFIAIMNSIDCDRYSEVTGRETKHEFQSCYVKHSESWYTLTEYKAILRKGQQH